MAKPLRKPAASASPETAPEASRMAGRERFFLKLRFGLKTRISLYERMEAFLDAGFPIVETLISIRNRYRSRKDFRAKILSDWIEGMNNGLTFEASVKEWLPPSEHMLISAGEKGEGLIKGLREATVMSNAAAKSKAAIVGGTMYPVALIFMLIGMMIMFQTKMAPVFKTLKPAETWPSSAHALDVISAFFTNYLWLVILIMIATATLVSATMGRWRGPLRQKFDRFPPWSIYRGYQASSFMIGLSSLMTAGIANYDALRMMHKNGTPWLKEHLERMMAAMRLGGANQGKALDTGMLDQEMAGDVEDYSRLGSFQSAIYKLGQRSLESGVKSIELRMNIIKNILLVAVVASVGWIYMTSYLLQGDIAGSQGAGVSTPR